KPTSIEVPAGSRVSFTNEDDITHTITSGTPESPDGKFSHRLEGKGATATVDLTKPGVYPYFCERHRSMRGEIRVKEPIPPEERAMKRVVSSIVGAVAAAAIVAVNIGEPVARAEAQQGHTMAAMTTSSTKASGLRSTLNTLFQEHIYLAAAATGAALGGRETEFKAAAAAL